MIVLREPPIILTETKEVQKLPLISKPLQNPNCIAYFASTKFWDEDPVRILSCFYIQSMHPMGDLTKTWSNIMNGQGFL